MVSDVAEGAVCTSGVGTGVEALRVQAAKKKTSAIQDIFVGLIDYAPRVQKSANRSA